MLHLPARPHLLQPFFRNSPSTAACVKHVRDDNTSKASWAIIKVAGITGRVQGMKYKRADGRTVRPTLVVRDSRGSCVEQVGFAWERGKVQ